MKKICFVMTVPSALRAFMADHVHALSERYRVEVFCNLSADPCGDLFSSEVKLIHIPFERRIRPWRDLGCLLGLTAALRNQEFDCIHTIMPKTGLLGMTAGLLARVPNRVHMFTGQVWATRTGIIRILLKWVDRLIAALATEIYADSPSQRDFLIFEKVISAGRVLESGSVCGVDINRFKPDQVARTAIRRRLLVPEQAVLFGFLGRLNRDKGILDLIEAFASSSLIQAAHLVIVGRDEEGIQLQTESGSWGSSSRIHFVDFTSEAEKYLAALDVFCLPSYREGFGSTVIEAAACGIPALASRIYGLTDAIVDGKTGMLHQPGDIQGLQKGLEALALDANKRLELGQNARDRASKVFPKERLVQAMVEEYERILDRG